jgi:hypothetical protein
MKKELRKLVSQHFAERICESEIPYYDADDKCGICGRYYIFDEVQGCYVENCCCDDPELLPNGEEI